MNNKSKTEQINDTVTRRISMKAAGKAAGTFTGIAQCFHSKLLLVISGFLLVQSYSQVVNTAVTAFEMTK